ncbi:hypothetical protein KRP22_000501 [Phytophthora ramorum]|nr:hypothetical protein KRP22_763 [Phytophthora ramorum]
MGKGQQQHLNTQTGCKGNGDDGNALAGSTLEDYFAAHKVSGHVSQHLLNISTDNDVMAAEKVGGEDKDGPDRILATGGAKASERKSEQDDYEDDYESETSTPKAQPPSELAGMTLSDYLHVNEVDAIAQEKLPRAGSLRALPPQLSTTVKKLAPTSDVSGMSLDHYLGASPQDSNSENVQADKKPSPKGKLAHSKLKPTLLQAKPKQQPFSVKGSGLIQGTHSNSPQNLSSDEESGSASSQGSNLTPFQQRQKRKDRAKARAQRHVGSGSSISKAILLTEAASSPSTILSVRDREKRKASLTVVNPSPHSHHPVHHGSHSSTSNFQPPLPKLAASSSLRSINHKDHDTSSDANGDDTAEKLPPL